MNISDLLNSAENGLHSACEKCPWNPKRVHGVAFGKSCVKHGVDWTLSDRANSMLIAQDPAGTTPEKTGTLCGVCNTLFTSDHSAQHGYSLWKAAVSLVDSGQVANRYMKHHYWTNAIMHGFKAKDKENEKEKWLEKQRDPARACCTKVLFDQVNLLSPRIIIATGKVTAESLFDLRLISKHWDEFSYEFSHRVYSEQTTLPSGKKVTVYCTYHSSATNVNTHVARLYSDETIELLTQRIAQLPDAAPARRFLLQYQGFTGEEKGMRVLLLHWLEIGEGIRRAYAESEFTP